MKRAMKYLMRSLLILLASLLLVLIIALFAVQTPFAKRKIVGFIEKQATELLTSSLSIGKLEGNFFSHIELYDILLHSENDTLAYFPEIRLSYRLLSLRNNTIQINEVGIVRPYVHLEQLSDSSWNIMHIMKPTEKDTTSSTFDLKVKLDKFLLNAGNIDISSPDSIFPKHITNLQILLSAFYSSDNQLLELKEFAFSTVEPTLRLQNLIASIKADKDQVKIQKLHLQTDKNALNIEGNYYFDHKEISVLNLKTMPLMLEEFAYYLPPDFSLKINPIIQLKTELKDTELTLNMLVQNNDQQIALDLLSEQVLEYFMDSTLAVIPSYKLAAQIQKLDLRDWLDDKAMHYILNGNFNVEGEGFDPKTLSSRIYGALNHSVANGFAVRALNVDMDYQAGEVRGFVDANGAFGFVSVKPIVHKVLSNRPTYKIDLRTKNLNIEPFMGKEYSSNLNLKAFVNGSGFDPKTLAAKSLLIGNASRLLTFDIDTIYSEIDYNKQNIVVKSLFLKTLNAFISANGNYNLVGNSDLQLAVDIADAKEITDYLKIDSLNTELTMTAHLTGMPEDLTADMMLGLRNSVYKTMLLNSLQFNASGRLKNKDILFEADALAKDFNADGFMVDSITLNASGSPQKVELELFADNADIRSNLKSSISINEKIGIALSRLGLNYKGYDWNLNTDTAHIVIDGNNYSIRDFVLQSPGLDSVQTIKADGKFSFDKAEDFKLDIRNIDLPQIANLFMPEQKVLGQLNGQFIMTGTAQQPILKSQFNLTNGSFQDFKFSTFEGDFNYNQKQMSSNIDIIAFDSGLAKIQVKMPAEIRFDSTKFDFGSDKNSPVNASFLVQKIPLSLVNAFYPTDEIEGFLESDIIVKGNLNQPVINGNIDLKDGKLSIKKYGIDYRKMQAEMTFDNNLVTIDTFHIHSRKGDMFAKGDVRFESDLYKGKMNAAGLKILFNKFSPFDHRQYHMELTGNVDMKADKDSTRFSGDLTIPEAMIFIPAVMNLMGKTVETDLPLPLLAAQLQKDSLALDSVVFKIRRDTASNKSAIELPSFAFLDNLQGKINLKIPRNFWIKNNDMRIELGGDIQLIKHKDFFELFGPINVLRGQYNLLGKVFVIKSGVITFEGGEEMNPQLAVQAQYSFRDAERIKHDLMLNVGGYLSAPEISFNYEERPISEGDALSYILFGTDLASLGATQQASLGSSNLDAGDIAKTAVASLLSSQMTKLLGNTLNMDYIEVKSGSFDNASFTVGKYITDKIFISYEQNIGKIENADVARYEMRMEYELFKFLFLQLTSSSLSNGLDLIFKFDEKPKEEIIN